MMKLSALIVKPEETSFKRSTRLSEIVLISVSILTSVIKLQTVKCFGNQSLNFKSMLNTMNVQSMDVTSVICKNFSTWQELNWKTISKSIAQKCKLNVKSAWSHSKEESSTTIYAWEITTWNYLKRTTWKLLSSWLKRWWNSKDSISLSESAKKKNACQSTKKLVNKSMKAWWSPKFHPNHQTVVIVRVVSNLMKKVFTVPSAKNATAKIAWVTTFHMIFKN